MISELLFPSSLFPFIIKVAAVENLKLFLFSLNKIQSMFRQLRSDCQEQKGTNICEVTIFRF